MVTLHYRQLANHQTEKYELEHFYSFCIWDVHVITFSLYFIACLLRSYVPSTVTYKCMVNQIQTVTLAENDRSQAKDEETQRERQKEP